MHRMLLWGAALTVLVVLAMLPGFAGLLVVGHASWHAYRDAVGEPAGDVAQAGLSPSAAASARSTSRP